MVGHVSVIAQLSFVIPSSGSFSGPDSAAFPTQMHLIWASKSPLQLLAVQVGTVGLVPCIYSTR